MFVKNFFNRLFIAMDQMQDLKELIDDSDHNPNSIELIRRQMGLLSRTLIFLEEILGYLNESTKLVEIPPEPPEQAGRALYDRLQIHVFKSQLMHRVHDLKKNIQGARHSLHVLSEMANHVTELKMFKLQESVDSNTRQLCTLQEHNEKSSINLHIMQMVLAGILAFDIMDRITGEWTIVNTEWAQSFVMPLIHETPGSWLMINLVMWFAVGYFLVFMMRRWQRREQGKIVLQVKLNRKLNMDALRIFLTDKDIMAENREYTTNNSVVEVSWQDMRKAEWGGCCPILTIEYDEKIEYILTASITYFRRKANPKLKYSSDDLKEKVVFELKENGIIGDAATNSSGGSSKSKKVKKKEEEEETKEV
jgi:hypothetical protein